MTIEKGKALAVKVSELSKRYGQTVRVLLCVDDGRAHYFKNDGNFPDGSAAWSMLRDDGTEYEYDAPEWEERTCMFWVYRDGGRLVAAHI